MDIELMEALRHYRKTGDPHHAVFLLAAMDRAGVMPDSPRETVEGSPLRTTVLSGCHTMTNTMHVTIGETNLLLFRNHVVGVQVTGQPAVINPDPKCRSKSTLERLKGWPFAHHRADLPQGASFDDLIRFKRT